MQKKIIAGISLMLMVIFIYGLFNDFRTREVKEENKVAPEKTIIRFMSSWGGIDNKSYALEELVKEFNEQNLDIQVINESISGEDFLFNLKTDFASNHPPDVFGLWPGSDLQQLIDLGKIADLKEIYQDDKEWQSRFGPRVREKYLSEMKIYSIPFEVVYEGLFVNKDLFKKYGIKVPENIDDLFYAIKRFNRVGIVPIAYNSTAEGSFIYQNLVAVTGGNKIEVDNQLLEDSMISSMEIMVDLYNSKAFPKNFYVLDDHSRNQMFINKKAAMIVQGSWFLSREVEESNDVDFIPFPLKNSRKVAIKGIGNGNFHITNKTFANEKKKIAALKFLKFLTSERSWELFSSLPGFKSTLTYEIEDDLKNKRFKLLEEAEEYVIPIDHVINREIWENFIIKKFPLVLEGKIKPEEVLDLGD